MSEQLECQLIKEALYMGQTRRRAAESCTLIDYIVSFKHGQKRRRMHRSCCSTGETHLDSQENLSRFEQVAKS